MSGIQGEEKREAAAWALRAIRADARWMMPAALALGAACRIAQYAADRSFWIDEASLVLNVRAKTAGQLLGPLAGDQAAPPLFLLAERGLFRLLGGSEFSLRLLPLAAGLAGLLLFAGVARRVVRPPWAALAVALYAVSDRLIWHATEVKPYGTDAFAAVLLAWIALGPAPGMTALRRLAWLAAAATALLWFSYPAVFVFAALSLALLPGTVRESGGLRDSFLLPHPSMPSPQPSPGVPGEGEQSSSPWRMERRAASPTIGGTSEIESRGLTRGLAAFAACNLPVAVSFLALLRLVVRVQQSEALTGYWQDEFFDLHRPWTWPLWLVRHLFALSNYSCQPAGFVLLPAMLVGAWALWRRRSLECLLILAGPIGFALLGALAQRYPFDGARLTTFLAPFVLLLAVVGLESVFRWQGTQTIPAALWGRVAAGAAAVAVAAAGAGAVYHLVVPRTRAHVRPMAEYLAAHARPGDGIYALEEREFACYWPAGDPRVHPGVVRSDQMPERFWIVWSFANRRNLQRLDPILAWARSFAAERDEKIGVGGSVYLFDRAGVPPVPPTNPPDIDNNTHKRMHPVAGRAPG